MENGKWRREKGDERSSPLTPPLPAPLHYSAPDRGSQIPSCDKDDRQPRGTPRIASSAQWRIRPHSELQQAQAHSIGSDRATQSQQPRVPDGGPASGFLPACLNPPIHSTRATVSVMSGELMRL